MTGRLLADIFGLDIERDNARVLFAGDSPNDAPLFGFFRNSVAVANFRDFASRSRSHPRWITARAGGAGFAELADALLAAREAA
jgi:hydroxymethylpyrimidine pyrophosphatase-like HAD family hydrolase